MESNFSAGLSTVTTGTNSKTYYKSATSSNVEEGIYQCYPHFNDGSSATASFTAIVSSIQAETCNFATIGQSATLTCYLHASSAAAAVTFAHSEGEVSVLLYLQAHSEGGVSTTQLLLQIIVKYCSL